MVPVAEATRSNRLTWFHDAVTVWAYYYRQNLKWKRGTVTVDLQNPKGTTTGFSEKADGKDFLLTDENLEGFFDSWFRDMGIAR